MLKKGTPTATSLVNPQARPRKHHYFTNGLVFMAFGLFATAAALAVVKPSAPPPPVYQAHQSLALPALLPARVAQTQFSAPFVDETRIRPGDTLAAVLQRLNIHEDKLLPFLVHDKDARSIYKLYPGRSVQAALDENGDLAWLRYYHTPGTTDNGGFVSKWLEITPTGDGGYTAAEHSQATDTQIRMGEGEIASSLFGATDAAGIPDAITQQMANIMASKIDFMQDLRKGDQFRVIYETHAHAGKDVGSGRVLAMEFVNQGKTYTAVWFKPKNGAGGYYDFSGSSLKGAFLRTALQFTRISSTFGMRKHPIHGVWKGHQGVDYAAPRGTPIHATADGTVEFIGQQNGYGNVIILKHYNKITTLYAHQSRFAPGLKKGDTVEQGQLIGYVGATGWATGPHLHYEFRIADRPVDPLSVDLPVARALEGADRQAFNNQVGSYEQDIRMLASLQADHVQLASR